MMKKRDGRFGSMAYGDLVATPARFPEWMLDRRLLPREPVPRIVARLRAEGRL